MLPPCFPPVSMVRCWFYLWRDNRPWLWLSNALLLVAREGMGRNRRLAKEFEQTIASATAWLFIAFAQPSA